MAHSYVWHDSFTRVTWHVHMCDMPHSHCAFQDSSYVCHDSFMCVTWLVLHKHGIPHPYVWHDSFTCVTRLIHTCDMTPSQTWHHSFIHVTPLLHLCTNIAPTTFGSCMHRYCSQCQKLTKKNRFVHTNTVIAPKYQRMILCFWLNVCTDIAPNAKDSFLATLRLAKIGVNTSEVFLLLRGDTN